MNTIVQLLLIIFIYTHPPREIIYYQNERPKEPSSSATIISPASTNTNDRIVVSTPEPKDDIVEKINIYRSRNGLSPLIYSHKLQAGATKRAKYLQDTGQWSHDGIINSFEEAGIYNAKVGENLAKKVKEGEILSRWINSKSHNDILLYSNYRYVGVGRYGDVVVGWFSNKQ